MSADTSRRHFLKYTAVTPLASIFAQAPAVSRSIDSIVNRRLRFTLNFSNPLARTLENQIFWGYLPASIGATQYLRNVQVSTGYTLHEDLYGHQILELSFKQFPALAQKLVTVTADVDLDTQVRPQVLIEANAWMMPERYIESNETQIVSLASELRRATDIETTKAIYEWVHSNITYAGYIAEDLGAFYALLHHRGDCTEYADLVVALARANGIPARMVGGYVAVSDFVVRAQDYHNWAEVYLDGSWRIVDAQKKNWLASSSQYITFRIYRDAISNLVEHAHRYRLQGNLQVML